MDSIRRENGSKSEQYVEQRIGCACGKVRKNYKTEPASQPATLIPEDT